jgi:GNAT superfamily N-acetyltransferase
MINYQVRKINLSEIESARCLQINNLDKHHLVLIKKFPRYFESSFILCPNDEYYKTQYLVLGAFKNEEIIGTISVVYYDEEYKNRQISEKANEEYWETFTEDESKRLNILTNRLRKTYINPPIGSYLIQDLNVSDVYRKNGVASRLISEVIKSLEVENRKKLYIEVERVQWYYNFLNKLKFECVKKTLSLKEKLFFNSWGSMLFIYREEK